MRILILILLLSAPALGAEYHVTQAGGGTHNGLAGNPWSVAEYNGVTYPTAGDTVRFTGTLSTMVRPATGGAAGAHLVLDFTNALLEGGNATRIWLESKNYVTLQGGVFGVAPSGTTPFLIWSGDAPAHDIVVRGWKYVGTEDGTAQLVGMNQWSNLLIENNTADNVLRLVHNARAVHDITIRNNWARTGIQSAQQADLIFLPDAERVTIEGNKLINRSIGDFATNHADAIQTFRSGAAGNIPPKDWTIRYNWIEQTQQAGDGSLSWLTLEGLDGHLKIYSNVFYGNKPNSTRGTDVVFGLPGLRVYYYGNTVIQDGGPGALQRFHFGGTSLDARNNAGMGASVTWGWFTWLLPAGSPWNNNFFFRAEDCQAMYVGPLGSCVTDPEFVDFAGANFALKSTSKLIGAADSSIGPEYAFGIEPGATWPGPKIVPRGASWDVGAYVAGGSGPIPPPPLAVEVFVNGLLQSSGGLPLVFQLKKNCAPGQGCKVEVREKK